MARMLLVDIYVPVLDQLYDCFLDDEKPVAVLISEISDLIAAKEETKLAGKARELWLCEPENGKILNNNCSLAEQGIAEGTRLMLV